MFKFIIGKKFQILKKKIINLPEYKQFFYGLLWIIKFRKFYENFNPLNLPGEVEKVATMIVIQILVDKTYSQ